MLHFLYIIATKTDQNCKWNCHLSARVQLHFQWFLSNNKTRLTIKKINIISEGMINESFQIFITYSVCKHLAYRNNTFLSLIRTYSWAVYFLTQHLVLLLLRTQSNRHTQHEKGCLLTNFSPKRSCKKQKANKI